MCDLGVSIEGTAVERRISDLNRELAARGITFRAHFWICLLYTSDAADE